MAAPRLLPHEALPQYPLSRDERLDGHSFVKWLFHRWMASRSFRLCTWEVQGMMRALFDYALCESPVGTLPDDEEELSIMLRCDLRRLRELRAMALGPLRNWSPCLSGAERRLMHPVVLEVVRDALERREIAALAESDRAVAMRRKRLVQALKKEGMGQAALQDDVLIQRMDEWILASHRGRRTAAVYRSAILHARDQKWFGLMALG